MVEKHQSFKDEHIIMLVRGLNIAILIICCFHDLAWGINIDGFKIEIIKFLKSF